MLKALGLIGLGRERVVRVPVDGQGRMRVDMLPPLDNMTILCLQAGNVNTGAFDPADAIIPRAKAAGAWVHVDGAFGLWAAAAPDRAHLIDGYADADSWATDAHKWLNVPYDCGLVFVREPRHLQASMTVNAPYLIQDKTREPYHFTPDFSRRARGVEVWAALRALGRDGLAEMIERNCRQATRFAAGLRDAGFRVLNEPVLNQVLISFAMLKSRAASSLRYKPMAPVGAAALSGKDTPPCASAYRLVPRQMRMSSAVSMQSSESLGVC